MNHIRRNEKPKRDNNSKGIFVLTAIIIPAIVFLVSTILSWVTSDFLNKYSSFESQSSVIADMVSGVIAAIAAGLVLYQLQENKEERARQNDIEEASFILQLNQTFIEDSGMAEIEKLLESVTHYQSTSSIITNDDRRQKVVNYLAFFDGLAPLVLRDVLRLDYIDDLMAYRFFLAVNNKEIQEKELLIFPGDYRGCFKLYKKWTEYRNKKGLKIHGKENSLDNWERFDIYANENVLATAIRIEQLNDHFNLTENQAYDIADLIYDTDPYIYPVLFSGNEISENQNDSPKKNARKIITKVLKLGNDKLFHKKNLYVCIHGNEIIGLIHWIKGEVQWDSDRFCRTAQDAGVSLNEEDVRFLKDNYLVNMAKAILNLFH